MVNEPMRWQLTVAELMDALREHQPNAVVPLNGVSDENEKGVTVLHNLQIRQTSRRDRRCSSFACTTGPRPCPRSKHRSRL
jgi:hypothetical protein